MQNSETEFIQQHAVAGAINHFENWQGRERMFVFDCCNNVICYRCLQSGLQ